MTTSLPEIGASIQSTCTKCRKTTRHLVVSVADGAAAKVECTICEGVHNYRSPRAKGKEKERAPSGESKRPSRSAASTAAAQEWETLVAAKDPGRAVAYRPMGVKMPRAGELLNHTTFGLGLVRKVIQPNKADVLFRDGVKRLLFVS
ncbi:MAG: hypothetical protein IH608_13455 [Proteobacteria bacterium]|nr:hypothetical protein [Pseudomonadota bacterium]